ncbi:MAG TPA: RluA family pseudouridine synthase [Rhabdochlamydiaceae bacterium]|nr:RluA family pseudouridine synthase [Rhabdochlamydiaceae bacterium]
MSSQTTEFLSVSEHEAGMRLDKLLSTYFPAYSRTYFQYLIEQGSVLVNGCRLKKREKPKPGDEIEVCFLLTPELSIEPENIPLDILYEDEHLLAINKPAGMVVHPGAGNVSGTFVNALLFYCKNLERDAENLRPGIVHRLDKGTSGVLLAAKTAQAHEQLVSLFCQRKIKKRYLAVCLGNPGDGLITAAIGRHPIKRKEMTVCNEGGKEAISQCKVLEHNEKFSLVEVDLITGRTHQIRVHLKYKNTPVLGDPVYGCASMNQKYGLERQMLHAYQITFIHPITHKPIEITAPLPGDIKKFINQINFLGKNHR